MPPSKRKRPATSYAGLDASSDDDDDPDEEELKQQCKEQRTVGQLSAAVATPRTSSKGRAVHPVVHKDMVSSQKAVDEEDGSDYESEEESDDDDDDDDEYEEDEESDYEQGGVPSAAAESSTKCKAASAAPPTSTPAPPQSTSDWLQLKKKGGLAGLKSAPLVELLTTYGHIKSGNHADLVKRADELLCDLMRPKGDLKRELKRTHRATADDIKSATQTGGIQDLVGKDKLLAEKQGLLKLLVRLVRSPKPPPPTAEAKEQAKLSERQKEEKRRQQRSRLQEKVKALKPGLDQASKAVATAEKSMARCAKGWCETIAKLEKELAEKKAKQKKELEQQQEKVDKARNKVGNLQMKRFAMEQKIDDLKPKKAAASAAASVDDAKKNAGAVGSWATLARGIETPKKLEEFFAVRQSTPGSTDAKLRIKPGSATKIDNPALLAKFASHSTRKLPMQPPQGHAHPLAFGQDCDLFLFHGSASGNMGNIHSEGLKSSMPAAHGTMLGNGVYGAPDPRKSRQYCGGSHGNFMIVCRFAVPKAFFKKNSWYDEFCVPDEAMCVPLWQIKVELAE